LCRHAEGRCGALTASPGDHRTAAQRTLFNQLLGRLHHYPQTRQHYNEHTSFSTSENNPTNAAA
jgi:hypothetical protein